MKKIILAIALCVGIVVFGSMPAMAGPITYTGFLTGNGGGITATDGWVNAITKFEWTVTEIGQSGGFILWQYDYTMTVPRKDISHFIVEVSDNAVAGDFSAGKFDLYSSTLQGDSNPSMPAAMYGLKFEPGTMTLTASFTTTRAPVWGDFYAKDGKDGGIDVTAWNTGFTSADVDPTDAPRDGSVDFHILRPDTTQKIPVPEPGTLLLLGFGLAGLYGYRLRKRG